METSVRRSLQRWICLMVPALGFAGGCAKSESANELQVKSETEVKERYRFFAPSRAADKVPLLVMLHGCDQNAKEFEAGTEMDGYAERFGFAVLYPDQLKGRNMANCWRWFDPENRRPESGELAEIKSMIDEVVREHATIDPQQIFVAGISSGAATAAALLACYPAEIQGAALHSSPALNAADNEFAAMAVMKFGPSTWSDFWVTETCEPTQTQKRFLVIQGEKDSVVNPKHADRLIEQFTVGNAPLIPYKMSLSQAGEKPVEILGRVTSSSQSFLVTVERMKHAWAGGESKKYFDPKAFSASELVARYLVRGEMLFTPAEALH